MNDYRERLYARYTRHAVPPYPEHVEAQLASRAPYLERLIRRHFPSERAARILELGCGHGSLIYFALKHGYRNIEGVDRSPDQVEAAHRLGLSRVRQGDLLEALRERKARSYDCIVAFDVLEHFTKDEALVLADLVCQRLSLGGRFIVHAPNGDTPFVGRIYFGDFTHQTAYTPTSIRQLLETAGFVRMESYEDRPVVHGVKSAVRHVLWHGIRSALRCYLAVETGSAPADSIFTQNFLTVGHKTAPT